MFILSIIDMRDVCGPMGSNHSEVMEELYFNNIENAKDRALKHYNNKQKKPLKKLKWKKRGDNYTTGDLSWVMYDINVLKTED